MDAAIITNLGAAGVIAAMWLAERRSAAARERSLEEAHRALVAERRDAALLIGLAADAARALSAVERTQRAVLAAIERLAARMDRPPPVP